MFKKLNLNFYNINVDNLIGDRQTKYLYKTFFEFDIKNQMYLESLITSKIKFEINPTYINITKITAPGSPPHTDLWKTALNIYITACNDKTYFWKNLSEENLQTRTNTNFYSNNIELTETFTANSGDCYLINTHLIHSVEVKKFPRYILRFAWMNHTFYEIENSIILL